MDEEKNSLLFASGITRCGRGLIAQSLAIVPIWIVTRKIIIAIAWTANAVHTSNNDRCAQRASSTVCSVWITSADELAGGRIAGQVISPWF